MTSVIKIVKDGEIDILDVIRRSSHADDLGADRTLASFMMTSTEVWAGYLDDEVACVCGLIAPTMLSDRAYLWLITTSLVDEHQFRFIRQSQIWMQSIRRSYPWITGDVAEHNARAQQWLKWLGAEFGFPKAGMIPFSIASA